MSVIHVGEYTTLRVGDVKVSVYDQGDLYRAGLMVVETYKDTVPNRAAVRVVMATRPVEVEVSCSTGNRRVVCLRGGQDENYVSLKLFARTIAVEAMVEGVLEWDEWNTTTYPTVNVGFAGGAQWVLEGEWRHVRAAQAAIDSDWDSDWDLAPFVVKCRGCDEEGTADSFDSDGHCEACAKVQAEYDFASGECVRCRPGTPCLYC